MPSAIHAEGLGKRYELSPGASYDTFRDVLADAVRSPRNWWRRPRGEPLWALRDVSFEIRAGSVTGIIGRNGAGKSTLLKILSRITRPTVGRAVVHGRMASLLEVGTGFHPELSGRHNVFLNGAILGMARREIARNFDAIVAFADVERFIDTPVKFYSTGMYLRLAFAVAAHLEAEILAVDEILAVGDLLFQRKCLGKMAEVAHSGRTVLLVSHNLAAIQALADDVLLLEQGRLEMQGPPAAVVTRFLERLEGADAAPATSDLRGLARRSRDYAGLVEGHLNGRAIAGSHMLTAGQALQCEIVIELPETQRQCFVGLNIEDDFGVRLCGIHSRWQLPRIDLTTGTHRVTCQAPFPPLVAGQYHLGLELVAGREFVDSIDRVATLHVVQGDAGPSGETPGREHGYVTAQAAWTFAQTSTLPPAVGDA